MVAHAPEYDAKKGPLSRQDSPVLVTCLPEMKPLLTPTLAENTVAIIGLNERDKYSERVIIGKDIQ